MPRDNLQERFEEFHRDNPHVYETLVKMARRMRRTGRERYSLKAVVEAARWHSALRGNDADAPYKLDNCFTSRYARLIEEREPDLRGFFVTRRLATEFATEAE